MCILQVYTDSVNLGVHNFIPNNFIEKYLLKSFAISYDEKFIKTWSGHPSDPFGITAFHEIKTEYKDNLYTISIIIDKKRTEDLQNKN